MATVTAARTRNYNATTQSKSNTVVARRTRTRRDHRRVARTHPTLMSVYRFLCWIELLPRRIAEVTTSFFACAIVLMLLSALFFAILGVMLMALNFWAGFIPGWGI